MSAGLHSNAHEARHIPVMLDEVLSALSLRDGGAYVDGTFGRGGYTRAILDGADTIVWAIDRDPKAIACGATLVKEYDPRLTLLSGRFGEMTELLQQGASKRSTALFLTRRLLAADRRRWSWVFFPFRRSARYADGESGPSAADIVNSMDEGELARLIMNSARNAARRVARAIVEARNARRSREPPSSPISCAAPCRRGVPRLTRQLGPSWPCVCM